MSLFQKRKAKHYKEEYYTFGEWTLESYTKMPKVDFLSADTETKLYLDNKPISSEELYKITSTLEKPNDFIKKNIEVRAYAFMLSDGKNFACFQCIEDFLLTCAMMRVKRVYWYNARFDFAIFDYYLLNNDWNDITTLLKEDKKRYRKMPNKTYQNLIGDFGQRYQMRLWYEYKNYKGAKNVHNWKMLDICNIFGGGLANNLESWKIKDNSGVEVRKLKMDYDNANLDNEEDMKYCLHDTLGLHLLAQAIDKELTELTGYSLFKGQYMTAGGLARKTLLKMMFKGDDKFNLKCFKGFFTMSAELDEELRTHDLYKGGIAIVNPYKIGCLQKKIYKYDSNSMYPDKMKKMKYPLREGKVIDHKGKKYQRKEGCIYLLLLENFQGEVLENKIPVYQDRLSGEYSSSFHEIENIYIWEEELNELKKWYDLDYRIVKVIEYVGRTPKGAIEYIDTFYKVKSTEKGAKRNGAKLLLNSAYGKLAQKIDRPVLTYELNEDGISHLVKVRDEIDEKQMLSVLVGSRVTAMARVDLLKHIRDICKENPKKYFIYCDTDSIHSLLPYDKCDDHELGKYKCEGIFEYGLYLAPKTYLLYEQGEYDVHCKGVNTKVVAEEVKGKTIKEACKIFKGNRNFKCLCGLNVKGGKALVWLNKMILRDDILIKTDVLDESEIVSDYIY